MEVCPIKEMWRSASLETGEPFVKTDGTLLMLELCVEALAMMHSMPYTPAGPILAKERVLSS